MICFSVPFMKGFDFLKPGKQEGEIKESITDYMLFKKNIFKTLLFPLWDNP